MARLILFRGTKAQRIFTLGDDPLTIGRQPENTVQLLDAKASRHHCRITKTEHGYELEDLGSRNATFVNGVAVTKAYLCHGDDIRVGNTGIRFEAEEVDGLTPSTILVTDESESSPKTVVEASFKVGEATLLDPEMEGPDVEHLRRAERALSLLYEGTQLLSSQRKPAEIFDALVALALDLTGGGRAFVALLAEGGALEIKAAKTSSGRDVPPQMAISRTIASVALGEKSSVLCSDAQSDVRFHDRQSVHLQQIRSALYVPLVSNDKALGVLGVDSEDPNTRFTRENLRHLSILTNHAAAALENARLQEETLRQRIIGQQLEIAREIQQNFLPSDLTISPRVEIAASSLPAMAVGGDFYDCIPLDSGRKVLVMGDVSGKGIPAALCMGRVMGDIKSQVCLYEKPSDAVASLNQAVLKRSTRGMFISVLLTLCDPTDMTFTMCNAGHLPPILLKKRASSPELVGGRGGPTLGIVENATYSQDQFSLAPGDMLVLYTDGITEACNEAGDFFGTERFFEVILSSRAASCEDLIETVFDRVIAFAGDKAIPDDLAMMVLRVRDDAGR